MIGLVCGSRQPAADGGSYAPVPTSDYNPPIPAIPERTLKTKEGRSLLPCVACFPRAVSTDLTNDPRIFGDNALNKRLVAVRSISIASAVMSGMSAASMRHALMSKHMGPVQFLGLLMMSVAFGINLLDFSIMTLEFFHVYRLSTASSVGFDFGKIYYMHPRVTALRHFAMTAFFLNVPLMCWAMACKAWAHLADINHQLLYACISTIVLFLAGTGLLLVWLEHRAVYQETYDMMVSHQQPLLSRMGEITQQEMLIQQQELAALGRA